MISRIRQNLRLARELGLAQTVAYTRYQLGLKLGWTSRALAAALNRPLPASSLAGCWRLPPADGLAEIIGDRAPLQQAVADLAAGRRALFDADPVALDLTPVAPLQPALGYTDRLAGRDIKLIWEPARFGWVFDLGRWAVLTGSPTPAEIFWRYFEQFSRANPPYRGPNWASAQEAALRLGALGFAAQVFAAAPSTTPARLEALGAALVYHARRIPPTLSYARAQNNNHLLTESLGLLLAAAVLPDQAEAETWRRLGWRWLCRGLLSQITPDGTYAQHSLNYHRLMLAAALWAGITLPRLELSWPPLVRERLAAATGWLLAQLDPASGRVPNLGHNDGADILPLSGGDFRDYRPVAQAAARAFLDRPCLEPGPWDELSLWLGLLSTPAAAPRLELPQESPAVYRLNGERSWATLRGVHFTHRPAHADQLHVDLWFAGRNIALDAGTYQYNAAPPWDNGLATTAVHNTLSVDGADQMVRAGRFRWTDWAQAAVVRLAPDCLAAEHAGYARLGLRHRRQLRQLAGDVWEIEDWLEPLPQTAAREHHLELHWLLPDGPFEVRPDGVMLQLPDQTITLTLSADLPLALQLIRAGEVLTGDPVGDPRRGWVSWYYAQKSPALAVVAGCRSSRPVRLLSRFEISCSR